MERKPKPIPRSRKTVSETRQRIREDSTGNSNSDEDENHNDSEKSVKLSKSKRTGNKRDSRVSKNVDDEEPSHSRSRHQSRSKNNEDNEWDVSRQSERLERELTRKERELDEERQENERALGRIKKLERDKLELTRELEDYKEEVEEYKRTVDELKARLKQEDGESEMDEESEKALQTKNLELLLHQKNQDMGQLVEDLEAMDEEKQMLQDKLTELKDNLHEATKQIETLASQHFTMKSQLSEAMERNDALLEENNVLRIKERDLLAFKKRHEEYLENLCRAVDIRVDVWKKMMFEKDEDIERLHAKIQTLVQQMPNTQLDSEKMTVQQLKEKIKERDEHIHLLNEKLAQATKEINSSSHMIETLQSKLSFKQDGDNMEKLIHSLQTRQKKFEDKLEKRTKQIQILEAENEEKSKENTQLLARLRSLETGIYGLPEAVAEIKDLKMQLKVRDKQIESHTQELNILQLEMQDLQDENEMLHEKAGIPLDSATLSKQTKRFCKNRQLELNALKSKVCLLEEQTVELKTRNYSLKKQLSMMDAAQQTSTTRFMSPVTDQGSEIHQPIPAQAGSTTREQVFTADEWKEKYNVILEENTALRKGLQEILDAMNAIAEEGSAEDITIQSPTLENLLREMSARGLINYPYAMTGFHLKVCNLEGKCSQLREELVHMRQQEKQYRNDIIEAQANIRLLQEKLASQTFSKTDQEVTKLHINPEFKTQMGSSDSINAGKAQEQGDSDTLINQESTIPSNPLLPGKTMLLETLESEIQSLKEENTLIRKKFQEETSKLHTQLDHLKSKTDELFDSPENQNLESSQALKFDYLRTLSAQQKEEIQFLLKRIAEIENENMSRLGFLERFRSKALHQISIFQSVLEGSVPMHLLCEARQSLAQLQNKYNQLLSKQENLILKNVNVENISKELRTLKLNLETEVAASAAKISDLENKSQLLPEKEETSEPPTSSSNIITAQPEHDKNMNTILKKEIEELEKSKTHLETQLTSISEKYEETLAREQELSQKMLDQIPRAEFDSLSLKLYAAQESLILAQDEKLKWKEIAEMTQNQIRALENMKDFERMELDSLSEQILDLASTTQDKCMLAKAQRQVLVAEKEKHLAIQQVQKLLTKLSQLEAAMVHKEKISQDKEMALISMHTQVILRYRALFAALHESHFPRPVLSQSSQQDIFKAFEMFQEAKTLCERLKEELEEEKSKCVEYEKKCEILEKSLNVLKDGDGHEIVFESIQKVQDSRIEAAKWKRKAAELERSCTSLRGSVTQLENRASELEENRIRLEQSLELKDSLTTTLIETAEKTKSLDTLSATSIPLFMASSTSLTSRRTVDAVKTETEDKEVQTESKSEIIAVKDSSNEKIINEYVDKISSLNSKIVELEREIVAKEKVIEEFEIVKHDNLDSQRSSKIEYAQGVDELKDALQVARDTIASLNDRIRSKEENVAQYRKLLAEVRSEMGQATDRHVQEMRALQLTIHQQQQAFTRMKTTLSQPVRDTLNVEGTIKDQLTRINELEDEVSELQHALGNVASQLAHARSEANRWRSTSETRLKEIDSAKESLASEEMASLRQKITEQHLRIEKLQEQLLASKESQSTDSEQLKRQLEDKEKEIEIYLKTLKNIRGSAPSKSVEGMQEQLTAKEKELDDLKEQNKQLTQKVSSMTVRLSKTKALNLKSGTTAELEELRQKYRELNEEKLKYEKELNEFHIKREEEEQRKFKTLESVTRWEESKKWKKVVDKLEAKVKELETEKERLNRANTTLRNTVIRLEKEKLVLDSRLVRARQSNNALRGGSLSKSSIDNYSLTSTTEGSPGPENKTQQQGTVNQEEVDRLTFELADMKELLEKTEFEGREEVEKLKMEIKCLKDRIVSQERQLVAYQIAQKGDPKVVAEIEKMCKLETQLQKQVLRLEEENLHLKLQIEQLGLETPRLRDRVQHLQKLVDLLKTEKMTAMKSGTPTKSPSHNSKKSLGELERTISALKQVIDKLQSENKRLKVKPTSGSLTASVSSEKLRASLEALMEEKRALMDKVQTLELEMDKNDRHHELSDTAIEELKNRLTDSEKRAESAEMKLKAFLDERKSGGATDQGSSSYHDSMYQKMRAMQEELERKTKLLSEAKEALTQAKSLKTKQPKEALIKNLV